MSAGAQDSPIATTRDEGASRVLIVRHGETFANAGGYFLGKRDEGVDERGKEQSREAVRGIAAWGPDRIVTSPLSRCRAEIAEPAAALLGIEPVVDERLREFDFGPLEGRTYAQVVAEGLPFPWGPGSEAWPPEGGGEEMPAFLARVGAVARQVAGLQGRTCIVAHGGVIRGIFAEWLSLAPDTLNQLAVPNVHGFVFNTAHGLPELELFGLRPGDFGAYR